VSEDLPKRILCLPMHPYLDIADQDRIIDAIREYHQGAERKRA
jgi:dTDP-4-amino-4,6-dideoxygalactose transaminase